MIPFLRSMNELMVITHSRNKLNKSNDKKSLEKFTEESLKSDRCINCENKKKIGLPELPKNKRRRWVKSKEALSKFFEELDYNNQIQSSYDLTLLDMQNDFEEHDAA